MASLHRRPRALVDILEQVEYLARRSPPSALRFVDSLEATLLLLAETPGMGAPCRFESPAISSLGLRRWPVKGFPKQWILYREIEDGLEVVRVVHLSRDAQSLLEEDLD